MIQQRQFNISQKSKDSFTYLTEFLKRKEQKQDLIMENLRAQLQKERQQYYQSSKQPKQRERLLYQQQQEEVLQDQVVDYRLEKLKSGVSVMSVMNKRSMSVNAIEQQSKQKFSQKKQSESGLSHSILGSHLSQKGLAKCGVEDFDSQGRIQSISRSQCQQSQLNSVQKQQQDQSVKKVSAFPLEKLKVQESRRKFLETIYQQEQKILNQVRQRLFTQQDSMVALEEKGKGVKQRESYQESQKNDLRIDILNEKGVPLPHSTLIQSIEKLGRQSQHILMKQRIQHIQVKKRQQDKIQTSWLNKNLDSLKGTSFVVCKQIQEGAQEEEKNKKNVAKVQNKKTCETENQKIKMEQEEKISSDPARQFILKYEKKHFKQNSQKGPFTNQTSPRLVRTLSSENSAKNSRNTQEEILFFNAKQKGPNFFKDYLQLYQTQLGKEKDIIKEKENEKEKENLEGEPNHEAGNKLYKQNYIEQLHNYKKNLYNSVKSQVYQVETVIKEEESKSFLQYGMALTQREQQREKENQNGSNTNTHNFLEFQTQQNYSQNRTYQNEIKGLSQFNIFQSQKKKNKLKPFPQNVVVKNKFNTLQKNSENEEIVTDSLITVGKETLRPIIPKEDSNPSPNILPQKTNRFPAFQRKKSFTIDGFRRKSEAYNKIENKNRKNQNDLNIGPWGAQDEKDYFNGYDISEIREQPFWK